MKKSKKKIIRSTLLYLIVIAVLSGLAYSYGWLNDYLQERLTTFDLIEIEINGNDILSRKDVLLLCGVEPGEKLLTIRPKDVVTKLLKSPYVKAAGAVRSLPSTLRINIIEREPVAFVYGRGLNLIDHEGYLIPVPRDNRRWNLPFVTGIKERLGTLGQKTTSAQLLKGIEIIHFASFIGPVLQEMVSELNMHNMDNLELKLIKGGITVKIDPNNFQSNLFILSEYMENYFDWEKLASIEYVDVRFKDQIIIKEKRS